VKRAEEFSFTSVRRIYRLLPAPPARNQFKTLHRLNPAHPNLLSDSFSGGRRCSARDG